MESSSRKVKVRADQALVDRGLAPSRAKAQELIAEGQVEIRLGEREDWKAVKAASQAIPEGGELRLKSGDVLQYVSRAGRKLAGALDELRLDVKGFRCLDLGQSTGGFTDCLLQKGASAVIGVDVGHGQLHPRLREHPQVTFFENLHVRQMASHEGFRQVAPLGGFDLIVVDLSFISVLPLLEEIGPWGQKMIVLLKPQFEYARFGEKQLVFDDKLFQNLLEDSHGRLRDIGWELVQSLHSKVRGKDGNQEFFIYAKKISGAPVPGDGGGRLSDGAKKS